MAKKTNKIDQLNLGETVAQLTAQGEKNRDRISDALYTASGVRISTATISRYLRDLKTVAESKAQKIISDHVDKTVPADLKALEAMEAQAYAWAQEASTPQAQRIAAATAAIASELDAWRHLIIEAPNDTEKTIATIIKTCMEYVQADAREQEQRLRAMRMAVQIIDLKLSKAGLLEDDQKGRIIFMQRRIDEAVGSDREAGQGLRLVFKRGDDEPES